MNGRIGRSLTTMELAWLLLLSLSAILLLGFWFRFIAMPEDFYRMIPRESLLSGIGALAALLAMVFRSPALMALGVGVANGFMGWWVPNLIGRVAAGYAPDWRIALGTLIEISTAVLILAWLVSQFFTMRGVRRPAAWWVIAQMVALAASVIFTVRLAVLVIPPVKAEGPAPWPWVVLGLIVPLLFCVVSLRAKAAVSGSFIVGTCAALLANDWTLTRPGFGIVQVGVGLSFWASALPLLVAVALGVAAGALFRTGDQTAVVSRISEFAEPTVPPLGDERPAAGH